MLRKENVFIFSTLVIATLFSIAGQSFNFPLHNNAYHIPFVLDYANTAEGPSDIFHQSLSRFISGFWVLIGAVATEKNIYAVFFGTHIVFRFLTLFMIWKIVSLLSQNKSLPLAVAACFILFFPSFYYFSPVGKGELLVSYLTHTQVVVAVVLAGWYFLLREQFLIAAAFTAIAFDFNAFVGVWLGVAAGVTMICFYWYKGIPFLVKNALKMLGIFIVIASPIIAWLLHSVLTVPSFEPFDYRAYLMEFYPYHHYFVFHLQETSAFIAFIGAGYLTLRWTSSRWDQSKLQIMKVLFLTYTAIFLIGMALPYVTGDRLILNLVPLRMDTYLVFLVALLILVWHGTAASSDEQREQAFSLIALFSLANGNVFLFITALCLSQNFGQKPVRERLFVWALMAVLVISHFYFGQAATVFSPSPNTQLMIFALQVGVIVVFLLGLSNSLGLSVFCITVASLSLLPELNSIPLQGVLLVTYALIVISFSRRIDWMYFVPAVPLFSIMVFTAGSILVLLVAAALFLPFLGLIGYLIIKKLLPTRTYLYHSFLAVFFVGVLVTAPVQMYSRGGIAKSPNELNALKEAQIWARDNTDPHTVFLPLKVRGFSALSRRPVWIDWHSGAMMMWAPEAYEHWSSRMKEFRKLETVSDAVILAKAEQIPFIIIKKSSTPMDPIYSDCIAFENYEYLILKTC